MSVSSREQLVAFIALIMAILILGMAPTVVSGLMGRTLPDSLIAVSDKTVTGLVGVLGTISAMIFRTNKVDDAGTENTKAAFEAITAAANATPPASAPQRVEVINDENQPVPVETARPDPSSNS